jgi:hypothetical protein
MVCQKRPFMALIESVPLLLHPLCQLVDVCVKCPVGD